MALCSRSYQRLHSRVPQFSLLGVQSFRYTSSAAHVGEPSSSLPTNASSQPIIRPSPLSALSTATLLRRLLMCSFLTNPILFTPGLMFMRAVANSKSWILNPDENKVLKNIIKPFVYDQFCAGTNLKEVSTTVAGLKTLGFSGVAICYSKEAAADESDCAEKQGEVDQDLIQFKNGYLETLDLCGPGDWLAIKMTGAGKKVMRALMHGEAPPPEFVEAMDTILAKAEKKGCRIWMDAEQQAVQKSIDPWTIDLMRRWNRNLRPILYNTTQAYLKTARSKLQSHLELATKEGWTLGVKLVRGAYITLDRPAIHDTKAQTDECYESIVQDLLHGTFPGILNKEQPKFELLLCGHNPGTISMALALSKKLEAAGQLRVKPEFAQLQGMADDIGCKLVQGGAVSYKALNWGSVQECMAYLVRRAVENRGAVDRIKDDAHMFSRELRRRMANTFRFRSASQPSI